MPRKCRRPPGNSIPTFIAPTHRRVHRRGGFRPALSKLEDRTLLATMNWINPAGGDWDVASNWVNSTNPSDQHVPTASDNAVIDMPDITVTHDSGTDAVNSITSQDPIVLNGGTLSVASASTINSSLTVFFNSLTNAGATLSVNGPLAVNGLLTLGPRTTLSGNGTVDAYGGLNLSDILVSIQGTTLNNHGTATWGGGGYYDSLSGGAVLNNLARATFTIVNSSGGQLRGGSFNNAGCFTASTAVGGDVDISSSFVNTGTVNVQGGELDLAGDGVTPSTGSFIGAAGTLLSLYDEVLAPSSVISSAGAVTLSLCTEAGTYSAAGGTAADSTTFTGPVLDLGSSLEVSNFGGGSVSFAPAVGGPVTLDRRHPDDRPQRRQLYHDEPDRYRQLRGRRVADAQLRFAAQRLGDRGRLRRAGYPRPGYRDRSRHHLEQPRRRHAGHHGRAVGHALPGCHHQQPGGSNLRGLRRPGR